MENGTYRRLESYKGSSLLLFIFKEMIIVQIYESVTKGRYQTLIGKTWNMFKFGRTPQQIAVEIKQPVEKIVECIDYCIKGRQQFIKSKTCGGCIYDKENCECPEDCVRDDDGHYTKYIR